MNGLNISIFDSNLDLSLINTYSMFVLFSKGISAELCVVGNHTVFDYGVSILREDLLEVCHHSHKDGRLLL
jgi:hypothetical protein